MFLSNIVMFCLGICATFLSGIVLFCLGTSIIFWHSNALLGYRCCFPAWLSLHVAWAPLLLFDMVKFRLGSFTFWHVFCLGICTLYCLLLVKKLKASFLFSFWNHQYKWLKKSQVEPEQVVLGRERHNNRLADLGSLHWNVNRFHYTSYVWVLNYNLCLVSRLASPSSNSGKLVVSAFYAK